MQIFIKSFNRPYYLDRCINSILTNVKNGVYTITILDDGTDPKYLAKIEAKYTNIQILKSEYYEDKVRKIKDFLENGIAINNMSIPASFWRKSISKSTDDYILLLEDDFWFTKQIDLSETLSMMITYNMSIMKLFFFNNYKFLSGKITSISTDINSIKPRFKISYPLFVKNVIFKNKFRSFDILKRFGVLNNDIIFDYYTLYSVAGAIFNKDYYMLLWENSPELVDEAQQLSNAYTYYHNNRKKFLVGCFKKDIVNTSFSSSATNMFADINLNVYHYNHELNEAWLNDQMNPQLGYPLDISDSEIINVLSKSKTVKIEEWEKWRSRFKKQYTDIGIQNE